MRSWLTALSILIGIMAIFALVSFGQGLSGYVNSLAEEMGTDKIFVQPKAAFSAVPDAFLSEAELGFVRKIKGVKETAGMSLESVKIQPNKNMPPKYAYLMSYTMQNQELVMSFMTIKVLEGRDIKDGDKLKATIGYAYSQPNRIFEKPISIGDKILLNDIKVEVIGIYEPVGNNQDDTNIVMTPEGMEEIFGAIEGYQFFVVQTEPNEDPSAIADKITEKLRRYKDEDEGKETFSVQTFEDAIETFGSILGVINAVLVLIALISVLISGINIMNTMYTSVLERTKDIGIMKAIGAKNRDIVTIFLAESGMLGLFGGGLGILFGYGIASVGGKIVQNAGYGMLQPTFPIWLIFGCLGFAFIVGAVSGLAPAIQASRQNPVDSLRYE